MAEGEATAKFRIRDTEHCFVFEKEGQRDAYFDWTEWGDTSVHWMRLEIPTQRPAGLAAT